MPLLPPKSARKIESGETRSVFLYIADGSDGHALGVEKLTVPPESVMGPPLRVTVFAVPVALDVIPPTVTPPAATVTV